MSSLFQITFGQHNQEILASVAPYMVVRSHITAQAGSRFPQNGISGEVPVGVINFLEVIDIQKNDTHSSMITMAAGQLPLQGRENGRTVGQHRQEVFVSP